VTLGQIRRDWTRLGEQDPLWAVCVERDKRNNKWDVEEFFASGRAHVDTMVQHLDTLGLRPGRDRALDFGCGVGRLSAALAGHFGEVVGVDISPPMLERARELDRGEGRCRFVLNEAADLSLFEDASFDLVLSSIVLQHLSPDLQRDYLREFVRVLRPGGVIVVDLPGRTLPSVKGVLFRYAPNPLLRLGQRLLLRYPAPMRMHVMPEADMRTLMGDAGADVVDAVEGRVTGPHWVYVQYFVTKSV
jgi:ubiquinone/menaquinone biosynthesis C-methylase UbiE